jgi:hypothetical protein
MNGRMSKELNREAARLSSRNDASPRMLPGGRYRWVDGSKKRILKDLKREYHRSKRIKG